MKTEDGGGDTLPREVDFLTELSGRKCEQRSTRRRRRAVCTYRMTPKLNNPIKLRVYLPPGSKGGRGRSLSEAISITSGESRCVAFQNLTRPQKIFLPELYFAYSIDFTLKSIQIGY